MTAALTLTKTTPRSWLQAGERLAVRNAPTSHGRVSFNISSALTGEKPAVTVLATTCDRVAFGCVFTWLRFHIPVTALQASIAIDAPAGHAPSTPLSSVELRLRAPLGWEIASAVVDGAAATFDAKLESVAVPVKPDGVIVTAVVSYRHSAGSEPE